MSRIAKAAALTLAAGAVVSGAAGIASANAGAEGAAVGSPGIISGNAIQVPIQIPLNLCGNTIDIVGLLNPTFGNTCANVDEERHEGHHHEGGRGEHGRW
ncbi:chaplin [Streptomyces olivoreticuli]|uniref:Chaplin domain-containing protein n=1 Tax=Streptomyces blastmyceticus TaxID=68180 RepID=A0ABN0XJH5_9ACTN|nr:chaplin [Streptomyces olivoreticuli]WKK24795.1 chaplin [Streptomyces olivoreticuli]